MTRINLKVNYINLTRIHWGREYELYALVKEGECLVKEYLVTLPERDLKQVAALFDLICTAGPPHNEQKFRSLGNDIYELKTRSGIRILCFFAGPHLRKALVLTHGFRKPGSNIVKREKKKAENWHQEYSEYDDIIDKIIVME